MSHNYLQAEKGLGTRFSQSIQIVFDFTEIFKVSELSSKLLIEKTHNDGGKGRYGFQIVDDEYHEK